LRIVIDNSTHRVFDIGRFAPVPGETEDEGMEQIIFSNDTITSAAKLNSLM